MPLALGPVKAHVRSAAEEISQFSGITNIGGWRATGSVPNSDHPKGLAIDVMTRDKAQGDKVALYAVQNASRLSVTYIIWWQRIWQDGKWANYVGPSPHKDHVHISFAPTAGSGGAPIVPGSEKKSKLPDMDTITAALVGVGGMVLLGGLLGLAVIAFIIWKGFKR